MSNAAWSTLCLAALLLLLGGLYLVNQRMRWQMRCFHCGAVDVVEIDRETLATRMVEQIGSGTPAGGSVRLQFDLKLTYRCHACGQTFTYKKTETQ